MSAQTDADFYCLLHGLINGQSSAAATGDRRREDRSPYDCRQLAAWFDGEHSPQQADFQFVRCRDLSPRGFSFFSEVPPRTPKLIIALGAAPFTFFEAEAVRSEPRQSERGTRYLIGCRFVRRWGG